MPRRLQARSIQALGTQPRFHRSVLHDGGAYQQHFTAAIIEPYDNA